MILRRIKAHIEKENWFAVFIDFCIVVIGVFIGFQMANWNEDRADAMRAAELQERLLDDFTAIAEATRVGEERVGFFSETAGEIYARLLAGTPPESEDDFARKINVAGSSHPVVGASPTFTEMLSTGDIGLVENRQLRIALVEYHQQVGQVEQVWEVFLGRFMSHLETLDTAVVWSGEQTEAGFPIIESVDFDRLMTQRETFWRLARLNGNLQQLYGRQLELSEAVLDELEEMPLSP